MGQFLNWFECIADVLNQAMLQKESVEHYLNLFTYLCDKYESSGLEIKSVIDTAIIENLFWEIPPENSESFWLALPENLQQLYCNFFGKTPTRYFREGF